MPLLSFLIPARSSGHCLEASVREIRHYLRSDLSDTSYEILIVPNRSAGDPEDGTEAIMSDLAGRFEEVRQIPSRFGVGKGAALKSGFLASRGQWIFLVDADLPFHLSFLKQAMDRLRTGCDFVTANRRLDTSVLRCPVTLLPWAHRRHYVGLLFNRVTRALLGVDCTDTQAGMKAMSRPFAEAAFSRQTCSGFFSDLEYFIVCSEHGFSHVDLPVEFFLRDEKSTVRLLPLLLSCLHWVPRLLFQKRLGHYAPVRGRTFQMNASTIK